MSFFDTETLRFIWWALLGVLLIAFAMTDGYDLGVGALLPFVARTDNERRMVINTIGANWEGHQVWFILGGGAIFAAWPLVYAVSFSGFYLAMFVVLAALILRPVGFKYRSKRADPAWRTRWDWALFIGGFGPALVFGVAVGNVLLGVPFRFDGDLRVFYVGSFFGLFSPFSLLCGLLSVAMLVMHGSGWLAMKVEPGAVHRRARLFGQVAAVLSLVLFVAGGAWVAWGDIGFRIVGAVDHAGPSNPLRTTAEAASGAWLANYSAAPSTLLAPIAGLAGVLVALLGNLGRRERLAFAGSAVGVAGIVATVGVSMFPFILPSSADANSSLTVWNASSTGHTLGIMLGVTVVFLPLILLYTAWALRVMRGRVTQHDLMVNPDLY